MKTDVNKINNRLLSDYSLLKDMGFNVLGVFLQGSQNYNLDYDGSDIDTKAIILPSLRDIVLGKSMVSTTHILPSNEHIDIKDIRLMFDCFKKQNINFLEILFTKYKYINPEYADLYKPMLDNREKIAHYNIIKAISTMVGMSLEKRKALCHPYPAIIDRIEKFGYDRKQLHHIIRLYDFIKRYLSGESYESCLTPSNPEYLLEVKSNENYYTKDEAIYWAEYYIDLIKKLEQQFREVIPNTFAPNREVEQIMEDVLYKTIKESILKGID